MPYLLCVSFLYLSKDMVKYPRTITIHLKWLSQFNMAVTTVKEWSQGHIHAVFVWCHWKWLKERDTLRLG